MCFFIIQNIWVYLAVSLQSIQTRDLGKQLVLGLLDFSLALAFIYCFHKFGLSSQRARTKPSHQGTTTKKGT